jgi:hypothetical protein
MMDVHGRSRSIVVVRWRVHLRYLRVEKASPLLSNEIEVWRAMYSGGSSW